MLIGNTTLEFDGVTISQVTGSRFVVERATLALRNGLRIVDGVTCPVFNALELFERSAFLTRAAGIFARAADDVAELKKACGECAVQVEDWTATVEFLCKACSEGTPHERHDGELVAAWTPERSVGFAVHEIEGRLEEALDVWLAQPGRRMLWLDGIQTIH